MTTIDARDVAAAHASIAVTRFKMSARPTLARVKNMNVNAKSAKWPNVEVVLSKADPKLGRVIKVVISKIGRQRISLSRSSPFEALVRAIVYQSVSGKAAALIYKRLQQSVRGALTPKKVLSLPQARLRAVGLSNSKTSYIRNLAEWFDANRKTAKNLPVLPDEEVVKVLTSIPGIGVWTANVFLIFNLQRLDVVPASDLGIRRGVQLTYGLKSLPAPELIYQKALRWQPYRSIASMYLWNAVKLKINPSDLR